MSYRKTSSPRLAFLILLRACSLAIVSPTIASDVIPGAPQTKPILLTGGDIYVVTGPIIQGGQILIVDGKIKAVGKTVEAPADAEKIDVTGKRIYPGMVDTMTDLGLTEIESIRATNDQAETGEINPNVRAERATNPDSELIPVVRCNGVLTSVIAPAGGTISGMAAAMYLDGWTWEDMAIKPTAGLVLNWPNMSPARGPWVTASEEEQNKRRDERLKKIDDAFDDAHAYLSLKSASGPSTQPTIPGAQPTERTSTAPTTAPSAAGSIPFDARWDAMIPVLEGKIPVIIRANNVQQIQAAVAFGKRQKVKIIIAGGADAPLCADLLRESSTPVALEGTHREPSRKSSDYDEAFTTAEKLRLAGVTYCISSNRWASLAANLPYQAGTAVAYGLPEDEAVRSITIYPAQIFGLSDRVGSIEVGKDATLFVASGNILEIPTHVERAWIGGRLVDLSNKQSKLWEKYKEKYRRMGIKN